MTGVVGIEIAAGSATRSSRSAGSNSNSAAPPDLNHTSGASGASGLSLPRTVGSVDGVAHFAALAWRDRRRPRPAAHLVMSPAPMHTIMSPGGGEVAQVGGKVGGAVDRLDHAVAVGAQALGQRGGVDALDRLLARGIDRRDEHHVGVVEGVLEVLHQVAQPGEAVRLDDRDDALLARFRAPPTAPRGFRPGGGHNRR